MLKRRPAQCLLGAGLALGCTLGIGACSPASPAPRRDIVSLVPSASVALRDMGLAPRIAGTISEDAIRPAHALPLGQMGHLDSESILKLAPQYVIASAGDVLPADPFLLRGEAQGRFHLALLPSPRTVAEALAQLEEVGISVGQPQAGRQLRERVRARLQQSLQATHARIGPAAPRVLLMVSLTPELSALGPGMLHGQLLETMGARNALPKNAANWVPLDREALIVLDPEVVVLLATDATPAALALAQTELHRIFANLPIAAVKGQRLHVVADALAMVPSSNLPDLAEQLADALAPNPHTP